jgi:hypothetical protein
MAPSGLVSTLEVPFSTAVIADVTNYYWPVWRYGQILRPAGGESLRVSDAQEVGSLFGPDKPAARRYLDKRRPELKKAAEKLGGRYLSEWPQHLSRFDSEPFEDLKRKWKPKEIFITYSFVPIIRLPRFAVEIGDCSWQVRESLTVCGAPSQSKAWITASLVAYDGKPADSVPLGRRELDDARSLLEPFAHDALESLIRYYQQVLNEDAASLALENQLRFDGFEVVTGTEIVSLASGVDLGEAFDRIEKEGLGKFRREASKNPVPGSLEVLDFLKWTESHESPGGSGWQEGKAKMLVIYADEPACGSVRGLVIPRLNKEKNRTWYAVLAERLLPERPVTCFPLSEAAGRFLATEYGRYF